MTHAIYRVTSIQAIAPYTLLVTFDDSTQQEINFEPILFGEIYGPLRDSAVFNQVKIDPEIDTIVWPNGADFDPATLHDWPTCGPILAERARLWQMTPV